VTPENDQPASPPPDGDPPRSEQPPSELPPELPPAADVAAAPTSDEVAPPPPDETVAAPPAEETAPLPRRGWSAAALVGAAVLGAAIALAVGGAVSLFFLPRDTGVNALEARLGALELQLRDLAQPAPPPAADTRAVDTRSRRDGGPDRQARSRRRQAAAGRR
jgi:hypothetical protein